jgi:uncharacterized protein YutE (UPF0331/DUF86 family)
VSGFGEDVSTQALSRLLEAVTGQGKLSTPELEKLRSLLRLRNRIAHEGVTLQRDEYMEAIGKADEVMRALEANP